MFWKKKTKKSKKLYDVKKSHLEEDKHFIHLNENSEFAGVVIRLKEVLPDIETGESHIHYEIIECPEHFKLDAEHKELFEEELKKLFQQLIDKIKIEGE